jgi:RNA polymerase sigma-70 factor, ECF subfamily
VSSSSALSDPAATFEPHRRRLLGLAYRMLGSMADAEDAVQETYLRWHATDRDRVSDPRAFLMTTTTRICLDMLTSARARREEYVGPWLPEPVVDTAGLAPDSRTELAEDLSIALLLILDQLSPLERGAFLLHDVFDFSFSEVGAALERSEAACRQLASRARAHVRAARPRGATHPPARSGKIDEKHAKLMSAFAPRGSWSRSRANARVRGGATTSRCALPSSMACPVSSSMHRRELCRRPRSRSKAT